MKNKHTKKVNWDMVISLIMTVISYFGTMCAGCYFAGLMEYGVSRTGLVGFIVSIVLTMTAIVGARTK